MYSFEPDSLTTQTDTFLREKRNLIVFRFLFAKIINGINLFRWIFSRLNDVRLNKILCSNFWNLLINDSDIRMCWIDVDEFFFVALIKFDSLLVFYSTYLLLSNWLVWKHWNWAVWLANSNGCYVFVYTFGIKSNRWSWNEKTRLKWLFLFFFLLLWKINNNATQQICDGKSKADFDLDSFECAHSLHS